MRRGAVTTNPGMLSISSQAQGALLPLYKGAQDGVAIAISAAKASTKGVCVFCVIGSHFARRGNKPKYA